MGPSGGFPINWAPDGHRLAATVAGQAVVVDAESGDWSVVSPSGYNPMWSEDGEWIACTGDSTPDGSQVLIVPSNGSAEPVSLGFGLDPRWVTGGQD